MLTLLYHSFSKIAHQMQLGSLDTIPGTLMCQNHKFSHFLQRVHCVEVKSAVDVEMFTALPDSASSLFTATQTANGCTGHA